SNAVLANLLAATNQDQLCGRVVNIGAGVRTSVNELAEMIKDRLGIEGSQPEHAPERVGEVRDSVADVSSAKALIAYEPITTLEDGLAGTVNWYRDTHEPSHEGAA
ncbi:unnamed protein product, partial [Laminaria digitata]